MPYTISSELSTGKAGSLQALPTAALTVGNSARKKKCHVHKLASLRNRKFFAQAACHKAVQVRGFHPKSQHPAAPPKISFFAQGFFLIYSDKCIYYQYSEVRSRQRSEADHSGRGRWIIENQGFNYQKNSGLNLEHAYSLNPDGLNIFYTLLQIAHMIMQLLIKGSLLKKLARRYDKADAVALFGSLKNIAKRLLECLRNYRIPDAAFDAYAARHIQLHLDTSRPHGCRPPGSSRRSPDCCR